MSDSTSATHSAHAAAAGEPNDLPLLFVKPGCPWCEESVAFLDDHGIPYRRRDISAEAEAREEMSRLSGQGKVPTLFWHGEVLADFGLAELVPFLRARNVALEDS
jgi:glutaredoxin 3